MIQARERNPTLDHVWGLSRAEDRIWAQIAPIAPNTRPWERRFVILQAFIDDSVTPGGTFVLGGYIASAEAWANFSREWEELLPFTFHNPVSGRRRFKMNEMVQRIDDVAAFYAVIRKYALMGISITLNLKDLERALKRVSADSTILFFDNMRSPYFICFRSMLDALVQVRIGLNEYSEEVERVLPAEIPVDFYFDEQAEKSIILRLWDEFIENRADETRNLYGATPRFENDEDFLPLQAADFCAWWTRKGYEEGNLDDILTQTFPKVDKTRKLFGLRMSMNEDQLVRILMESAAKGDNPPGHTLQDSALFSAIFRRIRQFFQGL